MRGPGMYVVLALLISVIVAAAGCGDSSNENIFIGGRPTTTAGGPTPQRTATAAARTATPSEPTPAATATPSQVGATATPTAASTPSGVDAGAQAVASDVVPFLVLGAPLATGVSSSALAATQTSADADKVDNCPGGGTRTDDQGLLIRTITLAACVVSDPKLGSFQFDGTITINFTSGTVGFNFAAKDLTSTRTVDFSGSLTGTVQQSGGFVLNGPVTVMTPQGNFTLTLHAITIDANHHLVSGSATATDDDDNFDIASLSMTVNAGGATANVVATFDDNSTANYVLDLQTGTLTPAS